MCCTVSCCRFSLEKDSQATLYPSGPYRSHAPTLVLCLGSRGAPSPTESYRRFTLLGSPRREMNSIALFPTGRPKSLTENVSKPFPDAGHLAGKEAGCGVGGRMLPLSFCRRTLCFSWRSGWHRHPARGPGVFRAFRYYFLLLWKESLRPTWGWNSGLLRSRVSSVLLVESQPGAPELFVA